MNPRQPKLPKNIDRYEFKKGDRLHLDNIYEIQAVCGNNWWRFDNDEYNEGHSSLTDNIIITRNITIVIAEY